MRYVLYIFVFSLLFSLYSQIHVCLNYLLNQDYYSEVLCVNKQKPNSCCEGKCALEKELNILNEEDFSKDSKLPVFKLNKLNDFIVNSFFTIDVFLQSEIAYVNPVYSTIKSFMEVEIKPPLV